MIKKITLNNGLRVILSQNLGTKAVTVLTLVEAGSKYETKEINGLSHFLEHMCFKGTTKRPGTLQIAKELDGLGSAYNAFTSEEFTGYYAKVKSEYTSLAIEIISDLYLNPTFPEKEIEKERGVIIEEINMYEDLPQRKVQELFTEVLYGDQPAGWGVSGKKEIIKKLNRDDFVNYRAKHYVPSATIVVVAGNFNEEPVVLDVKKYFESEPAGKKDGKLQVVEKQDAPQFKVQNKASDQTHLVIGVRAFSAKDDRRYALGVLSNILGGGMSSRLFERIREELGAAYYVRSSTDLLTDHGVLSVSAGIDYNKLDQVMGAILEEFRRLKDELVDEEHLNRAKEHITGNMALSLETSDDMAEFIGIQEILRKEVSDIDSIIEKFRSVTAEEIKRVAGNIFKNENLNMAIIGPADDSWNVKIKEKLMI
ncbi:MAG: hypothetical protein COV57_01515 [Candidatus Liptonbacteria bacterium CG11_big_fil_rev_8_21_14_0_20_35_14]|uniref:Peptidase M16 n=1 Tax=Candidatus Liptonbacteria bacterium CG11_big_fil_rev_8_21_14_0_20_35_14 TaxID=1974634 RepID=A0A2H0N7Z0_9BACT|nr:MAG: hypothetical protein COV57_01515 [Candidatus Liptonbacteria bacterium CG11_big_fil_rev_8_21_14_0_20_35_14]